MKMKHIYLKIFHVLSQVTYIQITPSYLRRNELDPTFIVFAISRFNIYLVEENINNNVSLPIMPETFLILLQWYSEFQFSNINIKVIFLLSRHINSWCVPSPSYNILYDGEPS